MWLRRVTVACVLYAFAFTYCNFALGAPLLPPALRPMPLQQVPPKLPKSEPRPDWAADHADELWEIVRELVGDDKAVMDALQERSKDMTPREQIDFLTRYIHKAVQRLIAR